MMAKATTKASVLTTLKVSKVEIAIGLFTTVAKPGKLESFDTAGPNGGVLKAQAVAKATPVSEAVDMPDVPVSSDPLGDAPVEMLEAPAVEASPVEVAGQYGRDLVEEGSGVIVPPNEIRKGVRLEDGKFVDCTRQLEEITEQTKLDGVEVIAFVDVTHIPRSRVSGAQYVGAGDEKAPYALRLLFEGLKATRRGAVVKLTKSSRQTLGVIAVARNTLVLFELVYSENFREPPARALAMHKVQVGQAQVDSLKLLIEQMGDSPAVLDEQRDDAVALREDLKRRALAGDIKPMKPGDPIAEPLPDAEIVDPIGDELMRLMAESMEVAA
jgi:hypothetical protein